MTSLRTLFSSTRKKMHMRWNEFRSAPEHSWKKIFIMLCIIATFVLVFDIYIFQSYVKSIDKLIFDPPIDVERLRESHFNPIITSMNTKQIRFRSAHIRKNSENIFR